MQTILGSIPLSLIIAFRTDRDYIKAEQRSKQKGGQAMKKSQLILLGLAMTLFLPNAVFSDCLTFGAAGPVSWYVQNERTIVFYDPLRTTPIAQVTLQTCRVDESSDIRLGRTYLCDSDKIIVDNRPCSIMTIISPSSGSFR